MDSSDNESLNTFEHLYTGTQKGYFGDASYGDNIISITARNYSGPGFLGFWDGSNYSRISGPLIGLDSYYRAIQVINANNIWAAGAYNIDGTHHHGLIHHYRNGSFELIETPFITNDKWSIYDFVILE